ncbi:hypothetical protein HRM2_34110 [Desulforapulum autotrophicum HRM2]|uniref:Uncharacterized protein n=1 Tax=Desulforapulum autotrophicum (strain ATCC 43914 / DSM 3382 / VKM B-1955 / HRM2) TaxID=177437 RepID=C0QMG9_DESAH|nr:hypothetical protein [Desulforapulum autotrophicum]ACN16486.1 hypothetical protein HRM2_34110 [Desulforapulum autotrophicum HRM2]
MFSCSGNTFRVGNNQNYALPASLELPGKRLIRSKLNISSPFDTLLIQLRRMQALFGFDCLSACRVPVPRAIRAIVKRAIEITFNPDKPWLHIRVLYQVIHTRDRMMNQVSDEVLVPDLDCLGRFFRQIKPDLDDGAVFLHTMLINAPIIFHAHNIDSVLSFLKKKKYSKRYLKQMEDMIVCQTRMLLGLPTDTLDSCSSFPRTDH